MNKQRRRDVIVPALLFIQSGIRRAEFGDERLRRRDKREEMRSRRSTVCGRQATVYGRRFLLLQSVTSNRQPFQPVRAPTAAGYFISCSRFRNKSSLKNSSIEMSRPSHIFLIVETVVLLFRPDIIFCSVDCVIPETVASIFKLNPCSLHRFRILILVAVPISINQRQPSISRSY